jgi:hypothetical protein
VARLLPDAAEAVGKRTDASLRITVTADGSVVPDLAGRTWTSGNDDPTTVTGPDWALLAWLVGRPAAVAEVLPDPPELGPWN